MELHATKREIQQTGFSNSVQEFKIKESALAFKILSDSLYSDKPMAVIRELSCNAYDAHVAAGTESKPFDVHLPNNFEPFFSIRDYGTGLSNNDVLNLYTTYFESTKSMSNKAIGCMGLGSKSPFSYVDQFTITSWFNGVKSEYQAWISEEGVPSITLIKSTKTPEENGLMIHMMVNMSDFKAFGDRARRFYHRFPVIPNISGNRDAKLTNVSYVLTGPNYKLRGNDDIVPYGEHKGAYAIQGVVAYPITVNNITLPLTQSQRELLVNMAIDIIFPIGQLEVAPNRENLSYSKRTQQNIIDALVKIEQHVPQHAKDVLAQAKNEYQAKKLYHRWISESSTESKFMRKVLGGKLVWNNIPIDSSHMKIYMYDRSNLMNKKAATDNFYDEESETYKTLMKLHNIDEYGDIVRINGYDLRNSKAPKGSYYKSVDVNAGELEHQTDNERDIVIISDIPESSKHPAAFIYHNYNGHRGDVYLLRIKPGFEQKVKDQFRGFNDFVLASTLQIPPAQPKKTRTSDVRKLMEVKRFTNYYYGSNVDTVDTTYDVANGGTYVVLYNKQVVSPKHQWNDKGIEPKCGDEDVLKLLYEAEKIGLISYETDKIYAFNSTHKGIIKKHPNWISIFDLIKQRWLEKLADKEYSDNIQNLQYFYTLYGSESTLCSMVKHNKKWNQLLTLVTKSNSKSRDFFNDITVSASQVDIFINKEMNLENNKFLNSGSETYYSSQTYDLSKIINFFERINKVLEVKTFDFTKTIAKAEKQSKQLKLTYPLINTLINTLSINNEAKDIALYINMCDKTQSLIKSNNQ